MGKSLELPVLWVEGKNDLHTIRQLLAKNGIPWTKTQARCSLMPGTTMKNQMTAEMEELHES